MKDHDPKMLANWLRVMAKHCEEQGWVDVEIKCRLPTGAEQTRGFDLEEKGYGQEKESA